MRPEDLSDYLALRRFTANPFEIVRFRNGQRAGRELVVRFRDEPPLGLRGGLADFHMFHRIFLRDEYRLRDVAPGSWPWVVDLGANVGIFAVRAAQIAQRVVALEPHPENFARLEHNVRERPAIVAEQQAVAAKPGTLRLYRPEGAGLSEAYDEVPATTLDDVFARHGIERCSLLKIDIEGAEYEVLESASDAAFRVIERIHGEYHNPSPPTPRTRVGALVALLEGKGFTVETVAHRRKENFGMFYARRPEARA